MTNYYMLSTFIYTGSYRESYASLIFPRKISVTSKHVYIYVFVLHYKSLWRSRSVWVKSLRTLCESWLCPAFIYVHPPSRFCSKTSRDPHTLRVSHQMFFWSFGNSTKELKPIIDIPLSNRIFWNNVNCNGEMLIWSQY